MIRVLSSPSIMPACNTKIPSTRSYRFAALCCWLRYCPHSHGGRCKSLRQAGSQRFCIVPLLPRSSAGSFSSCFPLSLAPDCGVLLSTFLRPSDLLSHFLRYGLVNVQLFLTAANRRCNGDLHPIPFASSSCKRVFLYSTS